MMGLGGNLEKVEITHQFVGWFLPFTYFSIQLAAEMNSGPLRSTSPNGFKLAGDKSHVVINKRYRLCLLRQQHGDYNMYQGIDLEQSKWVHIYVKLKSSSYPLSKAVKDNLTTQLCPKVIDSGEVDILKYKYFFEIHQRWGPSVDTLFSKLTHRVSGKELLHLLLQMVVDCLLQLKLIQKMDNSKLVCGELNPTSIVFDLNPRRTELYLLNCFALKKRNQRGRVMRSRFSSRGAHLGRTISIKDDLESICYILIDAFTQGGFLAGHQPAEYNELKLSLKVEEFAEGLPQVFVDFYYYVISLNYAEDINYFYWKTTLTKLLTQDIINQPYRFLIDKSESSMGDKSEKQKQIDMEDFVETFEQQEGEEKQNRLLKIERGIRGNQKFKHTAS